LLLLGAPAAVGLVLVLSFFLFGILPDLLAGILSLLLTVAVIVGAVWLAVRLAFWFVSIVVERLGPIQGLKHTFSTTRRRWWRVCGLGALLTVIFYVVSLLISLVGGVGALVGGPIQTLMGWVASAAGFVANLYLGFVALAALIKFYLDAKSDAPTPSVSSA